MPLPKDQELTKRRIKFEREKRILDTLDDAAFKQRKAYEYEWLIFVDRCRELGFCPVCEKQHIDCKCASYA